jgi:hypothetical protein
MTDQTVNVTGAVTLNQPAASADPTPSPWPKILSGGYVTATGALTALGFTSGALTNLVRNESSMLAVAAVFIGVAVLCGFVDEDLTAGSRWPAWCVAAIGIAATTTWWLLDRFTTGSGVSPGRVKGWVLVVAVGLEGLALAALAICRTKTSRSFAVISIGLIMFLLGILLGGHALLMAANGQESATVSTKGKNEVVAAGSGLRGDSVALLRVWSQTGSSACVHPPTAGLLGSWRLVPDDNGNVSADVTVFPHSEDPWLVASIEILQYRSGTTPTFGPVAKLARACANVYIGSTSTTSPVHR